MSIIKIDEAKSRARILCKYLRAQGLGGNHGQCLEAVARMEHFHDWATYLAAANHEAGYERKFTDVQDWPSYVFYYREDDDCVNRLYHLPKGVGIRIDRWGDVAQTGAVEAPQDFMLDQRVVVTQVFSHVPAIDKYGLPWFADENKAHGFFREELGCATLSTMEVAIHDTGDDSSARYWFEARVHPEYADSLTKPAES